MGRRAMTSERRFGPKPRSATERFASYVSPEPNSGCWLWTGGLSAKGYGRFRMGGKGAQQVGPHVFSYMLNVGKVPQGMYVLHHCDVPCCVNPSHIYVGTAADNARDAVARKRMKGLFASGHDPRRGRKNRKLTDADVRAIRSDLRVASVVAPEYGVCRSTIEKIRLGRLYRHV